MYSVKMSLNLHSSGYLDTARYLLVKSALAKDLNQQYAHLRLRERPVNTKYWKSSRQVDAEC